MKKDSANLTAQDILDHVFGFMELAAESGQVSAGLKACEMLGKERGLWRDRRENVNINLDALSIAELESYVTNRYGDKGPKVMEMLRQFYSDSDLLASNTVESTIQPGVVQRPTQSPKLVLAYTDTEDD